MHGILSEIDRGLLPLGRLLISGGLFSFRLPLALPSLEPKRRLPVSAHETGEDSIPTGNKAATRTADPWRLSMTEKQTLRIGEGKPGPGRPKGVPNRTTTLLKDAIIAAAEAAGGKDGLTGYLKLQATTNPQSFLPLLGKVLPMQITGEGDGPLKIIINKPGA